MLHFSIRRIEVLLAVADAGSFSAAATQLGIAQPSVSEHIRALEDSVGAVLLERRRGLPAVPTPAGAVFIEHARALLAQADALVHHFDQAAQLNKAKIVVAAQRKLGTTLLPNMLAQFASAHPNVNFEVSNGSYETVREMLLGGTADIGYFLGNEEVAGIESTVIATEPFVFVASSAHPLANRTCINASELLAYAFIRGNAGSQLTREIDGLLASVGLPNLAVNFRSTDEHVIQEFVEAGLSIYFTMEKSLTEELKRHAIKRLPVDIPPLTLSVRRTLSSRRKPSELIQRFDEYVRKNWPA